MKLPLAVLVFAALPLTAPLAAVAQAKPVAGKYAVHVEIAGNERDFTCNLNQKDKTLEGNCVDLTDFAGSIDGANITWHAKGDQATLNFVGKVAADGSIAGTVTAVEYSVDGDFKATLAK